MAGGAARKRGSGVAVCALLGLALGAGDARPRDVEPQPSEPIDVKGPQTPEDAQQLFQLDDGLRIELVAAEPLVRSPVAIAFDEDARLWVVEMPDYPTGPPDETPPEGRIVVLEDRDADGRFERSTVFMKSVLFATGILPWRGGAFVTGQFGIRYLKDTDGDGQADLDEPLYVGSYTDVSQHFLNSPTLGFDNWVYVANGLRTETVVAAGGDSPVDIRGMDFRFDPLGDRHEDAAGMGQFGMALDRWGQRFTVTNRNHLIHVVAPNRYLKRNPNVTLPRQRDNQASGGAARVYPLSVNWTTSIRHAGTFTAACGITVYDGDILGSRYRGSAFTAEPTGNLVHESILVPRGATFAAKRAREGVEFLASPDPWFRPVNLANGPDGALYVVDMYLADIEHPIYVPEDRRPRMDIRGGSGLGRIWRIVPDDHRPEAVTPALGSASPDQLLAALERPSVWWRTTAHRLILERQDRATVPLLQRLARTSQKPYARIHAAWLLRGLDSLDVGLVRQLLVDPHPRVREHAIRLAEPWIEDAQVREQLLAMAFDPDHRVRFQLALSLGELDDDRIVGPLARIAAKAPGDPWTRLAVGTAASGRAASLLAALFPADLTQPDVSAPEREALLREVALLVGAEASAEAFAGALDRILSWLPGATAWQATALNGLAEGLERRGRSLAAELDRLPTAEADTRSDRVARLLGSLTAVAADRDGPPSQRVEAVRLMALLPWVESRPILISLLTDDPVPEVSVEALRTIAAYERPEAAPILLAGWRSYLPEVRRAVLLAVGDLPNGEALLLEELEEERIRPGELTPALVRRLEDDPALGERAAALFQRDLSEEKGDVLARYEASTRGEAEASRGRDVFRQHCAQCHRVAGIGVNAGPDISDTRTKPRDVLLRDILDPSSAIDAGYVNYIITTDDGETLTGFIAVRSGSSFTLTGSDGRDRVVPREKIEEIRSDGISVMPEDFEVVISVDDMRDLIEFLKNWRFEER